MKQAIRTQRWSAARPITILFGSSWLGSGGRRGWLHRRSSRGIRFADCPFGLGKIEPYIGEMPFAPARGHPVANVLAQADILRQRDQWQNPALFEQFLLARVKLFRIGREHRGLTRVAEFEH